MFGDQVIYWDELLNQHVGFVTHVYEDNTANVCVLFDNPSTVYRQQGIRWANKIPFSDEPKPKTYGTYSAPKQDSGVREKSVSTKSSSDNKSTVRRPKKLALRTAPA